MNNIKRFVFSPFQENTYLLSDDSGNCIIIDPGCYDDNEQSSLSDYIKNEGLTPKMLLNTHGHLDHIFGNAYIFEKYGLLPVMHEEDVFLLNQAPAIARMYGVQSKQSPQPIKTLAHGDTIEEGEIKLRVIHAPGHSPGGICFYSEADGYLIAGDILFEGSVGRSDLPGGDHHVLIGSIQNHLMILPDSTKVYPGHGPATTIGIEKKTNPFLQG